MYIYIYTHEDVQPKFPDVSSAIVSPRKGVSIFSTRWWPPCLLAAVRSWKALSSRICRASCRPCVGSVRRCCMVLSCITVMINVSYWHINILSNILFNHIMLYIRSFYICFWLSILQLRVRRGLGNAKDCSICVSRCRWKCSTTFGLRSAFTWTPTSVRTWHLCANINTLLWGL